MRTLLSAIAVTLLSVSLASANPVGMATNVGDGAKIKHPGGNWQSLSPSQRVAAGDAVHGPAVIVIFSSGNRFRVSDTGSVSGSGVSGAQNLGGLSGPSARVAQQLGGARTGAFGMRGFSENPKPFYAHAPGYLLEGTRDFRWDFVPGAEWYTFTVFDAMDNIVWSVRVNVPRAQYPDGMPPLMVSLPHTKIRPYVWRLSSFGKSGKVMAGGSKWGVFSVLAKEDSDALQTQSDAFGDQLKATPNDVDMLLLQVELYRSYGVYQTALELWDQPPLRDMPGHEGSVGDIYRDISRYAQALANHIPGADTPDTTAPTVPTGTAVPTGDTMVNH